MATIRYRQVIVLVNVSIVCLVYVGGVEAKYSRYAEWGWDNVGSGPGQLQSPEDIDVGADGKVTVLDNIETEGNSIRVQSFEREGALVKESVNRCDVNDGSSLFASSIAKGLHIADNGVYWVAGTVPGVSSGIGSVWSFKVNENSDCFDYGLVFDTYHSEPRFYQPADDVVTDGSWNIFVADGDACLIQKYGQDGAYIRSYDNNGRPCPYGNAIGQGESVPLCDEQAAGYMGSGFEIGWRPSSLAIDSQGNLYSSDRENDYLIKIDTDDGSTETIGRHGSEASIGSAARDIEFHEPRGVAVDSEDNVYVADWCNGRVQKISPEGRLLDVMNAGAPVDEVAVDRDGFVFALDEDDSGVVVFKPEYPEAGQSRTSQQSESTQPEPEATAGIDYCAVPRLKANVESKRELSAGSLDKGLNLSLQSSAPADVKVQLALRMNDVNRLNLYRGRKKKTRVIGSGSTGVSGSSRSLLVRVPLRVKRALRTMKGRSIRVKATVTFRAAGIPRWRQLERRIPISVVIKRKGSISKRKISSIRSIVGISACAKRLNVSLKAHSGSLTKGIDARISSSKPARGSLTIELRGRDRSRLGLARNFKKRFTSSNIRLQSGRNAERKIRIDRETASMLARKISSKGVKYVRAKIVVSVKGRDGQRAWEAATVRLYK